MNDRIKVILENLPHSPGSYQMLDKNKRILYIGKAKDLSKRVNQYFQRAQNNRITRMVSLIDDINIIMTKTEKEALLLELNLVHKHMPPFNVLLKDDKQFPYIAIKRDQYPYLTVKRSDSQKGYIYYGPYTSSKAAWETINLLNRFFPLRKCRKLPHRACIYFHLGQCLAPCVNSVPKLEYDKIVAEIDDFLLGDNQKYINTLEEKATNALISKNPKLAFDFLDMVEAIKHINQDQNVQNSDHVTRDVINFDSMNEAVSLSILNLREGKLIGKQKISFVQSSFDLEEEIVSILMQYYQKHTPPKKILIPLSQDGRQLLGETLNADIRVKPHNEVTSSLLNMAKENANQDLKDYLTKAHIDRNSLFLLEDLQETLKLSSLPLHIDLFDNSHIQGKAAVGAAISYVNGEPHKPFYRLYDLKYGGNDFENMMDIIMRRLLRYKKDKRELPNLLVVDGGLIQINAALLAMDSADIQVPVVGLFKNDKHQTTGLLGSDGEVFSFEKNRDLFFLLTRMQDEVHRFALGGHKRKRKTSNEIGILDDIPGLGPKGKEKLNKHFLSVKALREATVDEISKVISLNIALKIKERLES